MNYWLLKSEPDSFSIDDLGKAPKQTTAWDGVRNFQARNMLRDSMKKGDLAFFYHSSCDGSRHRGHRQHRPRGLSGCHRLRSQASSLRCRFEDGGAALVRRRPEAQAQAQARDHARRVAQVRRQEAQGFRFTAPWESSFGHAGVEKGLGFRSRPRVTPLTSLPHVECASATYCL